MATILRRVALLLSVTPLLLHAQRRPTAEPFIGDIARVASTCRPSPTAIPELPTAPVGRPPTQDGPTNGDSDSDAPAPETSTPRDDERAAGAPNAMAGCTQMWITASPNSVRPAIAPTSGPGWPTPFVPAGVSHVIVHAEVAGKPAIGLPIRLHVRAVNGTGGHAHDRNGTNAARKYGATAYLTVLNDSSRSGYEIRTDSTGNAVVDFRPTYRGGVEQVIAEATLPGAGGTVKVATSIRIANPEMRNFVEYVRREGFRKDILFIGADARHHGPDGVTDQTATHWLHKDVMERQRAAIQAYREQLSGIQIRADNYVQLNDATLVNGGQFIVESSDSRFCNIVDVGRFTWDAGVAPWVRFGSKLDLSAASTTGHFTHSFGIDQDVAFCMGPNRVSGPTCGTISLPAKILVPNPGQEARYIRTAELRFAVVQQGGYLHVEGDHYHIRWQNPSSLNPETNTRRRGGP